MVLLLVLGVVIAILLRWLAIEPLRRLNEATRRVSAGDLSVQAPATSRDELGDLARAFNAMTAKLRQVLESLEQRVAERTAELSRVNETLESEIAVRKEFEEELARQATTDPLTGAYNRLKFNSELVDEIHRAQRYGESLSLAMIDVDHFKAINDTHGHQAGDMVLVHLTQLISANLRETDKLARWGGEEFMILLPNTPLDAAARLAEKLRLVVAQADIGAVRGITCSFAVTQFRPGESIETLTARLDEALYRAKHDGRNRVAQAA
ncbi:MAG TPA: diguanylate cyclase [Burkholderiaceae bacterium]|nr:diguanylate cyclase [Burkholderiaceae bacterium]